VQQLSTTVKMVAKNVLKHHLILVANSMTCTGNLNGNLGKPTFEDNFEDGNIQKGGSWENCTTMESIWEQNASARNDSSDWGGWSNGTAAAADKPNSGWNVPSTLEDVSDDWGGWGTKKPNEKKLVYGEPAAPAPDHAATVRRRVLCSNRGRDGTSCRSTSPLPPEEKRLRRRRDACRSWCKSRHNLSSIIPLAGSAALPPSENQVFICTCRQDLIFTSKVMPVCWKTDASECWGCMISRGE
jgi:hypothetical protein